MEQEVNDMQTSKAPQKDISIMISIKHVIGSIVPMLYTNTPEDAEAKADFALKHLKDAAKNKKR